MKRTAKSSTTATDSTQTVVKNLTKRLRLDFPDITFAAGEQFFWSPADRTVFYSTKKESITAAWALLHELSHALLGHAHYKTDFELLQMEVAAWHHAEGLSANYNLAINPDHVQDCLDTYRDWLHARSQCPACTEHGLQTNSTTYECLNCHTQWHVSSARFCRPYRMTSIKK